MRKPRLLDLFCGAGGAAMGYYHAGFQVTGIDIIPQPNYPFGFHQGDALEYVDAHGDEFDVVHASPPCKVHTTLKSFSAAHHQDLIPQTRSLLKKLNIPWVIENVPGAPLENPVTLCGSSFNLGVQRHRLFESNTDFPSKPCMHNRQKTQGRRYPVKRYHSGKPVITYSHVIGVYGRGQGLGAGEVNLWRQAMGISWMIRDELAQSIPPAYTEYVGQYLMAAVGKRAA
jgi:hypothetical protein